MSFKQHKQKLSEIPSEDFSAAGEGRGERLDGASLFASPERPGHSAVLRKTASGKTPELGKGAGGEQQLHATAADAAPPGVPGVGPEPEAVFVARGSHVRACFTRVGLQLTALRGPLLPCFGHAVLGLLPYEEILAAEARPRTSLWRSTCCTGRTHQLLVHTITRALGSRCEWKRQTIRLTTQDAELAREWAARLSAAVSAVPQRPRSLLVLVNPYGGARQALSTWERVGAPTFDLAGIRYSVLVTEREGHAREVVQSLSPEDLATHDGVVAVGGDGLFQELINGLLSLRAGGGPAAAAAARLRLGHIPAGSTDAVAFSLNGTRSPLTAALHIAVGDRMPIDLMRVDTGDGRHRFAACVASYGYMGDLMRLSERLRWMGPGRYNAAGALTLLRGRAYRAKISYRPADARRYSEDVRVVCRSNCNLCSARRADPVADAAAFAKPATHALAHGPWKTIEGEFKGVMALVSPCRSDRSTLGLFPYSHLADGRLHLILVRKCSVLQYLRFLASIPLTGVQPDAFPYVRVIDCTALHVLPSGPESCWNVDGELLAHNELTGEAHRGLLEVFARGVE